MLEEMLTHMCFFVEWMQAHSLPKAASCYLLVAGGACGVCCH
jgi:hypothetical protein